MDTVFEAFPKAIVRNVWQIGKWESNTRLGDTFETIGFIDVIISEGGSRSFGSAPEAETEQSDALLYVRPEQIPTSNLNTLKSAYMLFNGEEFYAIINAGAGKNQETGVLEHIELQIRQTEATNVE